MRVCLVTVSAPAHGVGGMQDHTRDLARGLVAAGHEVEVITARHPQGIERDEEDGVLWRYADAVGRHRDPRWRRASFETFLRVHAERPFDVVHGEGSSALELVRRGVHRRVTLVTMFHGNYLGLARAAVRRAAGGGDAAREARYLVSLSRKHFPLGNWWRFRACEAIVPSRQQLRDTCRSHLLDPRRVHVVPNGIDTNLFRPLPREAARDELGLPVGPLLVAAGRLNREKGFGIAIRALRGLPETRLVVVGDGEERQALERLARECGVAPRVRFAGAQPHPVLARYLAAADAFVFPTERDEAQGLVLAQAMACGAPAVASAVGAIPETIDRPGENGLLAPPGDADALSAAAGRVLSDPALARRLAEAGRRRAVEEYGLERMTARTLEVYAAAAARRDGAAQRERVPARAG